MGGPNRIAAGCTTGAVVNSACTAYFELEASPDFDLAGLRVGGQEHRQPLRRDRDRAVGRQLARHTRGGGAEGSGDADEYDDTPHMNCCYWFMG